MGILNALAIYLQPPSNLWNSIIFCCTSELNSLVLLLVLDDWGNLGFPPPLLFLFLWNRKPWLDNFMLLVTLVCTFFFLNMNANIHQRYFTHKNFRGANNCGQHALEKNIFNNVSFPPLPIILLQWKVRILWILWMKDKIDKQCRFIFTAAFPHIYQGCQY